MVKILNKIKSNKGASIFFALFVFLVCAGVGSVVLASGSAAAGRVSKVSEVDQRYYSVMSAVDLLKDSIDGQEFEIVRTKETTVVTVYSIESLEEGADTETQPERSCESETTTVEYTTSISQTAGAKGNEASGSETEVTIDRGSSLPGDAVIDLVLGPYPVIESSTVTSDTMERENTEDAGDSDSEESNTDPDADSEADAVTAEEQWNQTCPAFSGEEISSYTLNLNNGAVLESLTADIDSVLEWDGTNGKLTFTVTVPAGTEETNKYSAKIVFDALVTKDTYTEKTTTSTETDGGGGEISPEEAEEGAKDGTDTSEPVTETTTEYTKETKETGVKWVFSHIETKTYEQNNQQNSTEN